MKLSWPAKSRISENDIIKKARDAANHDKHCWVLKHLPKVSHGEDRHINLLSWVLIDHMGDHYKEHVLRIMVQEELYPITEWTATADLASPSMKYLCVGIHIQYHVVTAHSLVPSYRWLYEVPKILHSDISLNNLMLCKEGNNMYAALNDLDLAVSADVTSTSSNHHTGTKPFMVIDLIHPDPMEHMYRHDLESLFYVLVWITSRFNDGQEIVDPPLQEWADNDGLLLAEKKSIFLMFMPIPLRRTTQFELFGHCIVSMRKMFCDGLWVRLSYLEELSVGPQSSSPVHFANDTLGGLVTFDKFQTILDATLP